MSENIIFIACGSFNPPTPMHFRMFEIARDHFRDAKLGNVIGGIVSPVHNSYRKPNVQLISAEHRCQMIKMTLLSSEWIRLSNWEIEQKNWTKTHEVLKYHQNYLNAILNDRSQYLPNDEASWIPTNIAKYKSNRVRVKMLCGADILESFANRNIWSDEELKCILEDHGLVVISRHGCKDAKKCIFDSDLLYKYKANITIIENWVPNEISSTSIRLHLRRGLSVKYLLSDEVIAYILKKKLYGSIAYAKSKAKDSQLTRTKDESKDIIIDAKYENEDDVDETDNVPTQTDQSQQDNNRSSRKRKNSFRTTTNSKMSRGTL